MSNKRRLIVVLSLAITSFVGLVLLAFHPHSAIFAPANSVLVGSGIFLAAIASLCFLYTVMRKRPEVHWLAALLLALAFLITAGCGVDMIFHSDAEWSLWPARLIPLLVIGSTVVGIWDQRRRQKRRLR